MDTPREESLVGISQETDHNETTEDREMQETSEDPLLCLPMSVEDPEAQLEDDIESFVESEWNDGSVWWPDIIGIDKAELQSEVDIFTYTKATKPVNSDANPDLCRFCRVFFDTWEDVLAYIVAKRDRMLSTSHHNTIEQLQLSSSQGCSICSLLLSKLHQLQELPINLDFNEGLAPYMQLWIPRPRDWNPRLHMGYIRDSIESGNYLTVQMSPVEESDRPLEESSSPKDHSDTKCSDNNHLSIGHNSLASIRQWIKECCDNHPSCHPEPQKALPTRLIKVDGTLPRLCLTAGRTDCAIYCTLSHCWGKTNVLRLQKSNLQLFLQDIPSASLCKTFRDAIEITRTLGFSWLWIDSLCIVQDDNRDWLQESTLMSSVYGGSFLNIAATAAPDGEKGCLFERDPMHRISRQLKLSVNRKMQVFHYAEKQLLFDQLRMSPLAERAWVLQERLLAPRNLHFASSQLFWECKTKYACESFPHGIPDDFLWNYAAIPKKGLRNSWPQIVTFYSSCSLTYPSDKMVAISGIARNIQQHTGDEYIAGLWRETFLSDLPWRIYNPSSLSPRVRGTNCLPSWTWAAVKTEVLMSTHSIIIPYIELMDIHLDLANSDDPFGHVNGGTLSIRSHAMKRVHLPIEGHNSLLSLVDYGYADVNENWDYDEDHEGEFLLVPIAFSQNSSDPYNPFRFNALFLRRTEQGNGQYERVGLHSTALQPPLGCDISIWKQKVQESIETWLESEDSHFTPPEEGDYKNIQKDEDGRIWYLIDIV